MIRVDRGVEPPEVAEQRAKQLPLAYKAYDKYGPGSVQLKNTLIRYDAGKRTLYERQHRKCAYCERMAGWHNQPLEHYRPKAEAWRHMPGTRPTETDESRYWWLTWTWENQLFACTTCNGRATKGNYFPLRPGSAPLPTPARPCAGVIPTFCRAESPLLLDPTDPQIDPLDHIQWMPLDRNLAPNLWTWRIHTPTDEGKATEKILKLRQLEDDVNDRYADIWQRFEAVYVALRRHDAITARSSWASCASLVDTTARFAAATWWQLDALRRWALEKFDVQLPPVSRPR